MAILLQRLSLEQGLYNTDLNGRTIPIANIEAYTPIWSATNASISYSMEDYFINNVYVMAIQPSDPNQPVVISLDISDAFDADDVAAEFVAHAQFKSNNPNYVTNFLITDGLNTYAANSKEHAAGFWSVCRSNQMTIPENWNDGTYALTITITNHDGNPVKITSPTLILDTLWITNYALINMKNKMPDLYWDYDSVLEDPTNPFFRFIDVLSYQIGATMDTYSRWFQQEESEMVYSLTAEDPETRSRLTNPSTSYPEYSPWLFQFIGIKQVGDIAVSGTSYLDGTTEEFRIWQLQNSYFGRAAGTTQAIRESVKQVLTDGKTVVVTADPANWQISITTLDAETPSDNAVVQAAELARPLGYEIVHSSVASLGFILGNISEGLLGTGELG